MSRTPRSGPTAETIQRILDQHGLDLDTRDPYFGYHLLTRVAEMQLQGTTIATLASDLVNPTTSKTNGRTAAQWLRLMRSTSAEAEMMGDDGLSLEALRTFAFPILAMYGDHSPARLTGTELLACGRTRNFASSKRGPFLSRLTIRRGGLGVPALLARGPQQTRRVGTARARPSVATFAATGSSRTLSAGISRRGNRLGSGRLPNTRRPARS